MCARASGHSLVAFCGVFYIASFCVLCMRAPACVKPLCVGQMALLMERRQAAQVLEEQLAERNSKLEEREDLIREKEELERKVRCMHA